MGDPVYTLDDGTPITTHSMIKTFRRCPKKAEYKYARRLKPKTISLPLKTGQWLHHMLEAYYSDKEDVWETHRALSYQFGEMFEEEQELYGNLPELTKHIFSSYLWHYEHCDWIVHDVEFVLETEFPNGTIYRGRVDLLVENQFGLWLVDHKTTKSLPEHEYRILDAQSALYLWAALRNDIPVRGFIFNYLRRKAPTIPETIQDGSRISRWSTMATDYPTAKAALKDLGFWTKSKIKPYLDKLKHLKSQQYRPGDLQTSSFFRRDTLEKSTDMIKRVALEAYHTSQRLHNYFPPPHPDAVERVIDRSCNWMCPYTGLCATELFGGNTTSHLQNFDEGDPLEYYADKELWDG